MSFFEVGIFDFYSEKLCNALGITKDSIPPYISRMKKLGYPPGYQIHHHEKQNFVLALYGNYLSYVPGLCDSVFFTDDSDSRPTGSQNPDSQFNFALFAYNLFSIQA